MKLLLDHNLSPRLIHKLKAEFETIDHVDRLGMSQATDTEIWNHAKDNDYLIVTKDKDFLERSCLMGHPPKIIHLRLGNCSVQDTVKVLEEDSNQIKAFHKQTSRSYLLLP